MPSIGVLEHYQKPTDKPRVRVKRSAGQCFVAKGKAEWIIKNVLCRLLGPLTPTPLIGRKIVAELRPMFDYDYPANDFAKRLFWLECLLIHYPIRDQSTYV